MKSRKQNPDGLHQRFVIRKIVPTVSSRAKYEQKTVAMPKDNEYFILRLDLNNVMRRDMAHVTACRVAINAYAEAIKETLPKLSEDLKERYPLVGGITMTTQDDQQGK